MKTKATDIEVAPGGTKSPGILKPPKSEKKRARMMADKTPDSRGPTPRKRKPTTRARSINDVLQAMGPSVEKENQDATNLPDMPNTPKGATKAAPSNSEENTSSSDVTTACLKIVKPEGSQPTARWGHSLTAISEGHALLIGGQGDKQQFTRDSCWLLDIERQQWRSPDTTAQGPKPEMRMGHTATHDPTVRCVYVFGGSKHKRWFNDVNVLELDAWKWQAVKANGKAPTRSYHSTILFRHELWVFGGVYPQPDPQPDASSNDLHVFTPMEESWYMPIVMGEKPAPRSGHSATLLEDQMVMFGGWDYPTVFNDLHILDLTFVEWSQPKVNGPAPSPRSWHAACALSGKRVLIHGGYDGNLALSDTFIFNIGNMTWTEVRLDLPISVRAGHTALCLPYHHRNDDNDEVIVFGGGDNEDKFNRDLFDLLVPLQRDVS